MVFIGSISTVMLLELTLGNNSVVTVSTFAVTTFSLQRLLLQLNRFDLQ
jgi:hypothetical protein